MTEQKKAQEEIVGFVAIVVIITIIGLIFLGLTVKNNSAEIKNSEDIRLFLSSSLEFTSDCEIVENNYLNVEELLKECYHTSAEMCLNGDNVCTSLNRTMSGLLDEGYRRVGGGFPIIGYIYNSTYNSTKLGIDEIEIMSFYKGSCNGSTIISGDQFFAIDAGKIYARLKLCYS